MNHKLIAAQSTLKNSDVFRLLLEKIRISPNDDKLWLNLCSELLTIKVAGTDILATMSSWQPKIFDFLNSQLPALPQNPSVLDKAKRSFNALLLNLRPDNAALASTRLMRDYEILSSREMEVFPNGAIVKNSDFSVEKLKNNLLKDLSSETASYGQLKQIYEDLISQSQVSLINYSKKTLKIADLNQIVNLTELLGLKTASPNGSFALRIKSRDINGRDLFVHNSTYEEVGKEIFCPAEMSEPAVTNEGMILFSRKDIEQIEILTLNGQKIRTVDKNPVKIASLNPFKNKDEVRVIWEILNRNRYDNIDKFLKKTKIYFAAIKGNIYLTGISASVSPIFLVSVSPSLKFLVVEDARRNRYKILNDKGEALGDFSKDKLVNTGPFITTDQLVNTTPVVTNEGIVITRLSLTPKFQLYDMAGNTIGEF